MGRAPAAGRRPGDCPAPTNRDSQVAGEPMPSSTSHLALRLTPRGHLLLEAAEDAPPLDGQVAERLGAAFARGAGHGLLRLGGGEHRGALPPSFCWWRCIAGAFV